MKSAVELTVAIPTFGREEVLAATVAHVLRQVPAAREILLVNQTPTHEPETARRLAEWQEEGALRWLRLKRPSICAAMNHALREASSATVLFLDDDVAPAQGLLGAHAAALAESEDILAVTGQVLQPGETVMDGEIACTVAGLCAYLDFPFFSTRRAWVKSVMAGNLSVRRERALAIGGFDENFVGVAYRFETEFARRVWQNGGKVLFEPAASLRHLRAPQGGTRRYGSHLSSPSPAHGVGDYYFALRQGVTMEGLAYMLRRPFREVATRFHLRHPWYIPVKLVGEAGAFIWAARLAMHGPRYVQWERERAPVVGGR